MRLIFKKPYNYIFIFSFLIYISLLIMVSNYGNTLFLVFKYVDTINWGKLLFSLFLSLSIGFFIALNICLAVREYSLRRQCKQGATLTGAGIIAGLTVGICPLCVGGLLPIILGVLGISFSFGLLPFQGIEIQLLVLSLMILTTYMFYKRKI